MIYSISYLYIGLILTNSPKTSLLRYQVGLSEDILIFSCIFEILRAFIGKNSSWSRSFTTCWRNGTLRSKTRLRVRLRARVRVKGRVWFIWIGPFHVLELIFQNFHFWSFIGKLLLLASSWLLASFLTECWMQMNQRLIISPSSRFEMIPCPLTRTGGYQNTLWYVKLCYITLVTQLT